MRCPGCGQLEHDRDGDCITFACGAQQTKTRFTPSRLCLERQLEQAKAEIKRLTPAQKGRKP